MSSHQASPEITSPSAPGAAPVSTLRLAVWTLLFQLAWNVRKLPDILAEGAMPDPDDFLRLNQVRGWLAGQSWFDVSVARMNPPVGGDVHWSRLVDVPLAALIKFFGLFAEPLLAERLATIVWPTLLLIAVVLVMVRICDRVLPGVNRLLPLLFTVTCVYAIAEFAPGRIDHHSVQILFFSFALLGLANRDTHWGHALIGVSIALSIAVGIDAFLIMLAFPIILGLDWALGEDRDGHGLLRMAGGMSSAIVILFFVFVPPAQWLRPHPDAISVFYLAMLLLLSAAFVALRLATPVLPQSLEFRAGIMRCAAGAVAGLLAAGVLLALFPQVPSGGFAGLSEEMQTRWLVDITEAQSLPVTLSNAPDHWVSTIAYGFILMGGGAWALNRDGWRNRNLIAFYAVMVLCLAATMLQFRMLRVGILASIPLAIFVLLSARPAMENLFAQSVARRFSRAQLAYAVIVVALLSPVWHGLSAIVPGSASARSGASVTGSAITGAVIAAHAAPSGGNIASAGDVAARGVWRNGPVYPVCHLGSEFARLGALPKGRILNDLDTGPQLLVFTQHAIFSGNYHRNGKTILRTLDAFETNSANARDVAREWAADYVVLCDPGPSPSAAPGDQDKLSVRIRKGDMPAWLQRLSPPHERLIVLKVLKGHK